jgi:hypothetical protein
MRRIVALVFRVASVPVGIGAGLWTAQLAIGSERMHVPPGALSVDHPDEPGSTHLRRCNPWWRVPVEWSAAMKLTTIIGTAIAAVGLAACGSTVAPTARPGTPTPTVAATPTATPAPTLTATVIPTPSPSESPLPSASASPSPTEGPCGYAPCGTGWGYDTTCAVPGTAQGGSLIVTFTAGYGQTAPVLPDTITVDGNTLDVTSNPFTSGPYSVGLHSVTIEGFTGPFTVAACAGASGEATP